MKILIAEDDENSRVFLERSLRAKEYDVSVAADGVEALEKASQWSPDLIVSDILMPNMNGFELCRRIKTDQQLQNTPFIFYTATFVDHNDEKLAMDLGASRFLVKPMALDDLFRNIQEVIEEHRAHKLDVPIRPRVDMEEVCRMHVDALQRKLDKKVRQLEEQCEALSRSEERYRALIECTSDWIWEVDRDGVYTYVSPKIKDILGYEPDEVIGKKPFDFMPADEAARLADTFGSIAAIRQSFSALENVNLHKDGTRVVLETSGVPFFDAAGNLQGCRGIDRNITERKELENQLRHAQKMEAIGLFAGGIAHDFNNILSSIMGFSNLVKFDLPKEDDESRENIEYIIRAALRAKELVQHIMAFSCSAEIEKGPVIVSILIKEALKLLRASLPASIETRLQIPDGTGIVFGAATWIHQIIMNLCINAAHAMRAEGGVLSISVEKVALEGSDVTGFEDLTSGEYVKLTVSDTGHGIPKEIMNQIFDPFFTTKKRGEGTGMGLSVVYGIVKEMQGAIRVESDPGKGTSFFVMLPVYADARPSDTEIASRTAVKGEGRILFVDDEHDIAVVSGKLLRRLGYEVTTATGSLKALDLFKADPEAFDLVITDYDMPKANGIELSRSIQKMRPGMPIILCTGFSENITPETLVAIGIYQIAMKPVILSDLAEMVKNVLTLNKQERN